MGIQVTCLSEHAIMDGLIESSRQPSSCFHPDEKDRDKKSEDVDGPDLKTCASFILDI